MKKENIPVTVEQKDTQKLDEVILSQKSLLEPLVTGANIKYDLFATQLQTTLYKAIKEAKSNNVNLTLESIQNTCLEIAKYGILPSQGVYIYPYGNVLTTTLGYSALTFLAKRDCNIDIESDVVREGDTFTIKKSEVIREFTHTIANAFEPDRSIIGAYAVARNPENEVLRIETINIEDLMGIGSRSKNFAKNTSPYKDIAVVQEMYRKIVIRRLIKHLNITSESLNRVVNIDNDEYNYGKISSSKKIYEEEKSCTKKFK